MSSDTRLNVGSAPGSKRPRAAEYKKIVAQMNSQATSSIGDGNNH